MSMSTDDEEALIRYLSNRRESFIQEGDNILTTTKTKVAEAEVKVSPKTEIEIHQFQYMSGSMARIKVREMQLEIVDGDVGGYLAQRGYHLLPGSTEAVETWESHESTRFLIVLHLGRYLFMVGIDNIHEYKSFMSDHLSVVPVLPYLWFPEPAPTPDNYILAPNRPSRSVNY
jgi:hypothetical protein